MDEQEVRRIIAKDVEDFNNQPYDEELPDWLLDNFDNVIMEMPQRDCPYFARTIRKIRENGINNLTFYQAGLVLNIYTNTTPKLVCKDIATFLARKELVEQIMYRYNDMLKKNERRIELKQQTLMKALPKNKIITT